MRKEVAVVTYDDFFAQKAERQAADINTEQPSLFDMLEQEVAI